VQPLFDGGQSSKETFLALVFAEYERDGFIGSIAGVWTN
jgi:hypothetical protein